MFSLKTQTNINKENVFMTVWSICTATYKAEAMECSTTNLLGYACAVAVHIVSPPSIIAMDNIRVVMEM